MIDTVYVESEVREHPRTRQILDRLDGATVLEVERYGEVFNRRQQDFRLQKRRPALVLASKQGEFLHPVPEGFGVGGSANFYFSHLLNCPYDCSYCFLQGLFRSANYVLFVDYDAFFDAIKARVSSALAEDQSSEPWFFSGYDCDSLALDGLTGFASEALHHFADLPAAWLELRTKSVQLRALRERDALENVVVAFSLSPEEVADTLERGTPSLERRLAAMRDLADRGWQLGLRFDPVLWFEGAEEAYARMLEQVAARLPEQTVHSVSLGSFRLPRSLHRNMVRILPRDPLLASLERQPDEGNQRAGAEAEFTYPAAVRRQLLEPVAERAVDLWGKERFFPCEAWVSDSSLGSAAGAL